MNRTTPIAFVALLVLLVGAAAEAAQRESASPAASLMRLLRSGRVPPERLGTILELVCRRGDADDLAYIYHECLRPGGYTGPLRLKALDELAEAALTRDARPAGSLTGLGRLVVLEGQNQDQPAQLAAVRLAGIWKVAELGEPLAKIALDPQSGDQLRRAAIDALARFRDPASRAAVEELAAPEQPQGLRYLGVAALVAFDPEEAAARAAEILQAGSEADDPAPMIEAFLDRQGGADQLASAVLARRPPPEVARLALRYMYSIGRADGALAAALGEAAGPPWAGSEPKAWTDDEVAQLVSEVLAHGHPQRGEAVFRRADVSCLKCHAVGNAGGNVGPDLSAVGASSPVDYLARSILLPDQAVKEAFVTTAVVTDEGKVYQGIVVERDERRLILKDATGEEKVIPVASIEDQAEGRSLMPQGLSNFLSRRELVDLVRFLSELGRPGEFAIRAQPTIQRWRVLEPQSAALGEEVPNVEAFREQVLGADEAAWLAAYAKVGGVLPLDELDAGDAHSVLYVQGELDVTVAGQVGIRINSVAGTHVWVDAEPFPPETQIVAGLARGRHKVTLRLDTALRDTRELKVELFKPDRSAAEFAVVGGR